MGIPYEKQHLDFEQQLDRLVNRGMRVDNPEAAINTLRTVGYYRLSAYSHVLRVKKPNGDPNHDERLDNFVDGATFESVHALWKFDRELRLHFLDGLEQFEVALRTSIAYNAGKKDAFVHMRPDLLDKVFVAQPNTTLPERHSKYDQWLIEYCGRLESSRNEAFVKWFGQKYEGKLPIWAAVEVLQMGQLAGLFRGLELGDRNAIAEEFGMTAKVFGSAIAAFNAIRNISAHHSRLWNRTLVVSPGRPKLGLAPVLDHLHGLTDWQIKRVYVPLAELAWLLEVRTGETLWKVETRDFLAGFPTGDQMSLQSMGFPDSWENLELWSAA